MNCEFLLRSQWDTGRETEEGRDSMPSGVSNAYEGVLHNHAAKVLMRCLWLSRLARRGLSFAVQRLASRVTRWTLREDRQMFRLPSQLFTLDSWYHDQSNSRPQ